MMVSNTTSPGRPKAGVVGGGIAGLCASIALRRAGWEVEVFERFKSKSEVGAAITVTPPATAILEHWGFDFKSAQPVENKRISMLLSHNLQVIYDEQYPSLDHDFGHKAHSFHRVDLYHGLLELAQQENDADNTRGTRVTVHLGSEVEEVDCENAMIVLRDGSTVKKQLLVIADGAHSRLLEQFVGSECKTEPTGRSIYRILVPMDKIMSNSGLRRLHEDKLPGFNCFLDPVNEVLLINYACRNSTILNIAIVHNTKPAKDREDTWARPSSVAEALETIKNFHPTLQEYVRLANDDDVKIHDTYKHRPLDSFVRGRALILGDAAHVMLPTLASGCAVAIEAASTLEILFQSVSGEDTTTITERLAIFNELALPRCNMVMLMSNAGPGGHADPKVKAEIEKYYPHPLPPDDAGIWSAPFRDLLFGYDVRAEAEKLLKGNANASTE